MSLNPRVKRLEKAIKEIGWKSSPPRWVSVVKKDGKFFTHAPVYGEPDIEWIKPKDWREGLDGLILFTTEAYEWAK